MVQVDAIMDIVRLAGRTTTTAATTGRTAVTAARLARAATAPIVGLNVVLLAFSIYDMVDASVEIHKERTSRAGDLLREVAAKLDEIIAGLI